MRYEGIADLYDESNRYIHPSNFFKLDKVSAREIPEDVLDKWASFWFLRPSNNAKTTLVLASRSVNSILPRCTDLEMLKI